MKWFLTRLIAFCMVVFTSSRPGSTVVSSFDPLRPWNGLAPVGLQGLTPISSRGPLVVFLAAFNEGGGGEGEIRLVGGGARIGSALLVVACLVGVVFVPDEAPATAVAAVPLEVLVAVAVAAVAPLSPICALSTAAALCFLAA